LTISAIARFDPQSRRAEVEQHGERMVMEEFAPFFEAVNQGALVAKLKEAYVKIRETHPTLPPSGTKNAMTSALHAYEAAHPDESTLLASPAQFYGFSKGANLLRKYVEWITSRPSRTLPPSSSRGGRTHSGDWSRGRCARGSNSGRRRRIIR
jgi:putative ATP-dependent endonuclease of the OLD family